MAGESTSSTLTGWYVTQLSNVPAWYALDPNPAQDRLRVEGLDRGSKVKAFSRITKDTALSGTITEATGLSNTALDTDQVTATVAEVGILRQFTKLAERTNLMGPGGLLAVAVEDGVKMCLEKFETDTWAQFANASTSVGTSGAAYTIANSVQAQSQHVVNKSRGNIAFMMAATAGKNLRQDIVATGGAIFGAGAGDGMLRKTDTSTGYMGNFLGDDYYTNNLASTSGADSIGAAVIDNTAPPEEAATGCALGWMPEASMPFDNPVFSGGTQVAITMAYGLIEVLDRSYVKITTIT